MTSNIFRLPDSADLAIQRAGLHQVVAQRLRAMIVEGVIAPGAKLNERELSEALNVSRTPLREAIKQLAAEGLVELLANRGAVAAQLSTADIEDTFEVIAGLEALSGSLAAKRITDIQLREIKALHFEMLAAYERRDLSAYYARNSQIHKAINEAAGNPVLSATYSQVNARLQALRFRSNQDEAKWSLAVKEHEQMIDALERRDSKELAAILTTHLTNKRDAILSVLAATQEQS